MRWGKYKFFNYISEFGTYGCQYYNRSEIQKQYSLNDSYIDLLENKTVTYKPIRYSRSSGFSLYDLEKDPFELINLAEGRLSSFQANIIVKINNFVINELSKEVRYPLQGVNNKSWDIILSKIFRGLRGKKSDKMKSYLKESGRLTSDDCWGLDSLNTAEKVDLKYLKQFYDMEARPAEQKLIDRMVQTTPYFSNFTSML